ILVNYPQNMRVKQALKKLPRQNILNKQINPPQNELNDLFDLFNKGQLQIALSQAQYLIKQYSDTHIIWNLIGVIQFKLGEINRAIEAFKKVIKLNPTFLDGHFNLANISKQQGNYNDAIINYKKVIVIDPMHADTFYNLGVIYKNLGDLEESIRNFKKVLQIDKLYLRAYDVLGGIFLNQDELDKAFNIFNKYLSIKPNNEKTYNNLSIILQKQGKLNEAIEACKKAISINPNFFEAYNNLGLFFKYQGNLESAEESFKKVVSINKNYSDAYNNLGSIFLDRDQLDHAIKYFRQAISIDDDHKYYNNLGIALQKKLEFNSAIEAYNKSILRKPNYANAYYNKGNTLKDQGKLDEAIITYNKALLINPAYTEVYNNIGLVLQDQGKSEEAIESYNKSILLKPDHADTYLNLSFALLNSGKLKEGLDKYEWRWKTAKRSSHQRYFLQPLWDGIESLSGKRILIWSEQGVGDTMNWSSCLSLLTSKAEHCILECQEKLVPLLERSFPNVEVKAENRNLDTKRNDFDFHLPMGSLYKCFIDEITQITKPEAYLIPDPLRVDFWKKRLNSLGDGPYVGISWKSAVISPTRSPNYAPISDWYPLLTLPKVTFINLQYKDFQNDLTKIRNELGVTVHNFDDLNHYDNLLDVAALSAALDIVVSTRVTPPIISSGVGTPTKIANWRQSSWNNLLFNPTSSSIEMFDRDTCEPWKNVFHSIAEDIFKLT
ncbi:tetratricopeptide repeat protein, partial [Alphaproteobacteria bacterium]|nr:tetratricopeptide repeat protein [Alphaproteobacteria bacterium]